MLHLYYTCTCIYCTQDDAVRRSVRSILDYMKPPAIPSVSILLITITNDGEVMFLHLSVILFTGGCFSAWWYTSPLADGMHPTAMHSSHL